MPELWRLGLALAGVVAGSIFAYAPDPPVPPWLAVATGAIAITRRRWTWVRGAGVAAVCFGATLSSVHSRPAGTLAARAERAPRCDVAGVLSERTPFGMVAALDRATCESGASELEPGSVLAEVSGAAGTAFEASGWLTSLPPVPRGHVPPHVVAAFDPMTFARTDAPRGLHAVADSIRGGLDDATESIDPTTAEILKGLVAGSTERIPVPVVDSFRRAGLSHVLAVSGSNVAIVVGGILLVTRRLALAVRLGIATAGLVTFVAVVGPEPSVLRASLVGAVALAALAGGMKTRPLHVLFLVTVLLLVARPWLIFAAGLHLSLAATAGILLWTRPLTRTLWALPFPLAAVIGVTLAAQAAVAPITIVTFGEFSLVAPLANALALPAVAPATILGMAAGVAGAVFPAVGGVLALPAGVFANWVARVAETCGGWGWAAIDVPHPWGLLVAVPVLAAAGIALKKLP